MENTKRTFVALTVLGGICFSAKCSMYISPRLPNVAVFFITFLLLLFLTIAATAQKLSQRKSKEGASLAFLGIVFILGSEYLAAPLGALFSDKMFLQQSSQFMALINDFESGKITCSPSCNTELGKLDNAEPPPGFQDVWAERCDETAVVVLFRQKTSVPLLHEGYLFFNSSGGSGCKARIERSPSFRSRVVYMRHVSGDWFKFSDQPGF